MYDVLKLAPVLPPNQIARFEYSGWQVRSYPVKDPLRPGKWILFPGVSGILNSTQSDSDRQRLENWRKREIAAGRDPNAAMQRGTNVHYAVEEAIIRGRPLPPLTSEELRFFDGIDEKLETFDSWLWSERPLIAEWEPRAYNTDDITHPDRLARVVSYELGAAGTPDIIAKKDGEYCLIDLKTAKVPYYHYAGSDRVPWEERRNFGKSRKTLRQCLAYRQAALETLGVFCTKLFVLVATPDTVQLHQYSEAEIRAELPNLRHAARTFWDKVAASGPATIEPMERPVLLAA